MMNKSKMKNACPDCGVALGQPHEGDCSIEQCSVCGMQWISCECEGHAPKASAWAGELPTPSIDSDAIPNEARCQPNDRDITQSTNSPLTNLDEVRRACISAQRNGLQPQIRLSRPMTVPSWCHAPARADCPHLRRFCDELQPDSNPVLVPVCPERLYGDGPVALGRCYAGVSEYQNRVGGTFQHGWMIWETAGLYLRAYHHCVHWDGANLIDLCNQYQYRQILFLPTVEPGVEDENYTRYVREFQRVGVPCRYFRLGVGRVAMRIVELHEIKDGLERHSEAWYEIRDEIDRLEFHTRGSKRVRKDEPHLHRPQRARRPCRR
jgi:hypothetical protein